MGRPVRKSPIQLGTFLSRALATIGVTEERVAHLITNCGCRRRAKKLDELSDWAYNFLLRIKDGEEGDMVEKGKKELEEKIMKH